VTIGFLANSLDALEIKMMDKGNGVAGSEAPWAGERNFRLLKSDWQTASTGL
jgi:hypothetical protein